MTPPVQDAWRARIAALVNEWRHQNDVVDIRDDHALIDERVDA